MLHSIENSKKRARGCRIDRPY